MLPKILFFIALGSMIVRVGMAEASSPELAKLDRLMAQQLEVERATSALQLEAQQTLADNQRLVALYQQEHKALTKALARRQQQQDEVAEKRSELLAAQAEQELSTDRHQQQLTQGKAFLQTMWPQLPPPLAAEQQKSRARLYDGKLGLSERFAAMIGILTALEEFNSAISLHQGSLSHEGDLWHAEQLFIGLSQGYYRLPNGKGAGIGKVIDGIWQWRSAPEYLAEIDRAFEIYQGKQPVDFVSLPVAAEAQP